jgi:hypothetical protein
VIATPRADVVLDRLVMESAPMIVDQELDVVEKSKRVGAVLTIGAMTRTWRVETKVPSLKDSWKLVKRLPRPTNSLKNLLFR